MKKQSRERAAVIENDYHPDVDPAVTLPLTQNALTIGVRGRVYLEKQHPICPNFRNPQTDVKLYTLGMS